LNSGTALFQKLEVILQPTREKRKDELRFYEEYFSHANCYGMLDRIFEIGSQEAIKHGIKIADAFHIAAASLAKCGVFITGEKLTSPIFRTKLVRVVSTIECKRADSLSIRKFIGA
jgi:hypothetical protein